jgi:hypothetical protein
MVLGASSIACALALSAPVSADVETEARVHYDRAVKLYEDGDFGAALAELKRAMDLRPSPRLLYNIGQVRVAMQDYSAAIEAYREYLEKGAAQITPARRDMVQQEIARLEQRVARVTLESDVSGAEVSIDGVPVGVTPLASPLVLNAGTHRLVVRHPDYPGQSRELMLVGGGQERVTIHLGSRAPAGSQPESAASPRPDSRGQAEPSGFPIAPPSETGASLAGGTPEVDGASSSLPWAAWIATGALAAGAVTVGVLTMSQNSSLDDARKKPNADPEDIDSRGSRVRTLAVVGDVLAVGAVAAGAVSLWLTLRSSSPQTETTGSAFVNNLELGLGPGQIRVGSKF